MEKCAALMNAQNVWSWACFFGHGDIVSLTKNTCGVQLEIHFPYDKFDKEREDAKVRNVVTAGAKFTWSNYPDLKVNILYITWSFN